MVKEGAGVSPNPTDSIGSVQKAARVTESVLTTICRVMNILGIVVLMGMVALTVIDVIGRYFKRPIIGSTEITEFMMVVIVFLCLGWVAIKGKMVSVDLFTMRLSAKTNAILNSITLSIGLVVVVLIAWQSILATLETQKDKVNTMILHIPAFPFMWVLSVGFCLLALVMLMLLVQNVAKAVRQ
jgi:TRAP-type C4-dicarboxylate transport system permease small subunit